MSPKAYADAEMVERFFNGLNVACGIVGGVVCIAPRVARGGRLRICLARALAEVPTETTWLPAATLEQGLGRATPSRCRPSHAVGAELHAQRRVRGRRDA